MSDTYNLDVDEYEDEDPSLRYVSDVIQCDNCCRWTHNQSLELDDTVDPGTFCCEECIKAEERPRVQLSPENHRQVIEDEVAPSDSSDEKTPVRTRPPRPERISRISKRMKLEMQRARQKQIDADLAKEVLFVIILDIQLIEFRARTRLIQPTILIRM